MLFEPLERLNIGAPSRAGQLDVADGAAPCARRCAKTAGGENPNDAKACSEQVYKPERDVGWGLLAEDEGGCNGPKEKDDPVVPSLVLVPIHLDRCLVGVFSAHGNVVSCEFGDVTNYNAAWVL